MGHYVAFSAGVSSQGAERSLLAKKGGSFHTAFAIRDSDVNLVQAVLLEHNESAASEVKASMVGGGEKSEHARRTIICNDAGFRRVEFLGKRMARTRVETRAVIESNLMAKVMAPGECRLLSRSRSQRDLTSGAG